MYQPEFFKLQELVSDRVFHRRGELAWELLQPQMLKMIDEIRAHFNKSCTINDWLFGGGFRYSGLREIEYYVENKNYSSLSQHILGNAYDIKIAGVSADEARAEIIHQRKNHGKFKFIGAMELDTPTWVHVDGRQHDRQCNDTGGIFLFKP